VPNAQTKKVPKVRKKIVKLKKKLTRPSVAENRGAKNGGAQTRKSGF
jgi:hypothetical protein